MANGEASNVSNSESVSEANDEPEISDEKMTDVSPEESNAIEIRNISNDKGEESKFTKLLYILLNFQSRSIFDNSSKYGQIIINR